MNILRGGAVGLILIGALAALPETGVAGEFHATPQQREACRPDYFRFCFGISPTSDAVVACPRVQQVAADLTLSRLLQIENYFPFVGARVGIPKKR